MPLEKENNDINHIKSRTVKGVLALISRQYILQGLAIVANISFGVFLSAEEYGAYFVVAAIINFLAYFDDIGLGAALIQKKKKVTEADLSTTFFIQESLSVILIAGLLLGSSKIQSIYSFSQIEMSLFYALIAAYFMASLKSIPTILLQRELKFDVMVIPEILEQLFYYITAIVLASLGYGLTSFLYAVLIRGVVGLVSMYWLRPWRPKLLFSIKSAKKLTSFGAQFQLNSLLAVVKDDLLIVFLGSLFTRTEMGYITWAQKWTKMPLTAFLNSVLSVTFPVFSRLQDNKEELVRAIDKSLFFVSTSVFPSVIGLMLISEPFFQAFPKYDKWLPAVPLIYFFGASMLVGAFSNVLTNTLNSLGKVKITLVMMVVWLSSTWIFTLMLINSYGYLGVSIAAMATSAFSFLLIPLVKKQLPIHFVANVGPAFISSLIMAFGLMSIRLYLHLSPWALVGGMIGLGVLLYGVTMMTLFGTKTRMEVGKLVTVFRS